MTATAELRIDSRRGVFVADECEIDGPWVHAAGRWRWHTGANYAEVRHSTPQSWTWPAREVREIRWMQSAEAATA